MKEYSSRDSRKASRNTVRHFGAADAFRALSLRKALRVFIWVHSERIIECPARVPVLFKQAPFREVLKVECRCSAGETEYLRALFDGEPCVPVCVEQIGQVLPLRQRQAVDPQI